MHPRVRIALMTATTLLVFALGAVVLWGKPGASDGSSATGLAGSLRPPEIPPLDFSLVDQDGRPASLRQYHGRVVILTFMYSTCQDTCPVTAEQIRGALDDLGHDVPALAVSVDPVSDTPLNARRFLARTSMTGRLRFLLGSRAQLAPVWNAYGIQPQTIGARQSDHSVYVLLIDKSGRQRVGFPISELTPEGLAHDLRKLESAPA
jgi:protein SCO1/2